MSKTAKIRPLVRLVATLTVLCLLAGLLPGLPARAATVLEADISKGDVSITLLANGTMDVDFTDSSNVPQERRGESLTDYTIQVIGTSNATTNYNITVNGDALAATGWNTTSVNLVLNGVSITTAGGSGKPPLDITPGANVALSYIGNNTLTAYQGYGPASAGIRLPDGARMALTCEAGASLTAMGGWDTGGRGWSGAGIGGNGADRGESAGEMEITTAGILTATGGAGAAGIGGGSGDIGGSGPSGRITPSGGTLTASGGSNSGAGIGGGGSGGGGTDAGTGTGTGALTIAPSGDAKLIANGGYSSAGIGGGNNRAGTGIGALTIAPTDTAIITATGSNNGGAGIGGGNGGAGTGSGALTIAPSGDSTITATGGGAGIGGGSTCAGTGAGTLTIAPTDTATITATGKINFGGAGIGGGNAGTGTGTGALTIVPTDTATITAIGGGAGGAGIGGGSNGAGTGTSALTVTPTGGAAVFATGGAGTGTQGGGAGIGGGGARANVASGIGGTGTTVSGDAEIASLTIAPGTGAAVVATGGGVNGGLGGAGIGGGGAYTGGAGTGTGALTIKTGADGGHGTVVAVGALGAAGIGGGEGNAAAGAGGGGANLTILGGYVTPMAGASGVNAIGPGTGSNPGADGTTTVTGGSLMPLGNFSPTPTNAGGQKLFSVAVLDKHNLNSASLLGCAVSVPGGYQAVTVSGTALADNQHFAEDPGSPGNYLPASVTPDSTNVAFLWLPASPAGMYTTGITVGNYGYGLAQVGSSLGNKVFWDVLSQPLQDAETKRPDAYTPESWNVWTSLLDDVAAAQADVNTANNQKNKLAQALINALRIRLDVVTSDGGEPRAGVPLTVIPAKDGYLDNATRKTAWAMEDASYFSAGDPVVNSPVGFTPQKAGTTTLTFTDVDGEYGTVTLTILPAQDSPYGPAKPPGDANAPLAWLLVLTLCAGTVVLLLVRRSPIGCRGERK